MADSGWRCCCVLAIEDGRVGDRLGRGGRGGQRGFVLRGGFGRGRNRRLDVGRCRRLLTRRQAEIERAQGFDSLLREFGLREAGSRRRFVVVGGWVFGVVWMARCWCRCGRLGRCRVLSAFVLFMLVECARRCVHGQRLARAYGLQLRVLLLRELPFLALRLHDGLRGFPRALAASRASGFSRAAALALSHVLRFAGCNFPGGNFARFDFAGFRFTRCSFPCGDFAGCRLSRFSLLRAADSRAAASCASRSRVAASCATASRVACSNAAASRSSCS